MNVKKILKKFKDKRKLFEILLYKKFNFCFLVSYLERFSINMLLGMFFYGLNDNLLLF